jgi:DNA-binding NarL/FixJ family response regulator
MEPDVLLAQAWRAEGGVSEAPALARQAAEVAASQHQPAVEVVALHTTVCFGDRAVADRLAHLATQIDGPRAGAATAHTAATRAHQLTQACEGARTPALAAIAAPLPLTHREREIVTPAAGGLSNREIAQRLVVSVRTVENHLYRASTKLSTTDRTELVALLHGH